MWPMLSRSRRFEPVKIHSSDVLCPSTPHKISQGGAGVNTPLFLGVLCDEIPICCLLALLAHDVLHFEFVSNQTANNKNHNAGAHLAVAQAPERD